MSEFKVIKQFLLEIEEAKLKAQLKAIRKMLPENEDQHRKINSMSGVSIVYNILKEANTPLHINDIISLAKDKYNVVLDRAISKLGLLT